MIELHSASVVVDSPDGPITLLHPTSLSLTEHRIGIIGPNGSGKSTLVRLINGLVLPATGEVLIDGLDTGREGREVRRRVGFVFTHPDSQLVMPTPLEDVTLSLRRSVANKSERRERAREVLSEIGLADRADVSVHALSGGQKQLLALAGVLATEPELVVADEPTTLLDLRNARLVAARLFGLRQRLVLVTHDLDLARRCDRVLVVDDARVVFDGAPDAAVDHYIALAEATP
ncbi:cobalt ABC transporter ATP-binding protein [Aeromicrobium sp. PE09-221]|uniref:energy-coupling factor ABC transporter ATP-binding protein n=1 Tax=Aeromicrobium sp. PE09-221 TaxID=1898043 RepID=UPI000B3E56C1|nr:ABC transporter ATP-binding protein [Aeromicrobium sp. PE09-221]OUZ10072.1 cobalt ABC transporter ATP-binding protein [Aeromicrobium sp. PE09-221]